MKNMREDEQAEQLTKFLEGDHSLVEQIEEDVLLSVFLLRPDWMQTQHPNLLRPSISIDQIFDKLQSGVFVDQVHSDPVDDVIVQDVLDSIEEYAENLPLAEDIEWMENVLGTHNRRPSLTIDGILATVKSGPFSTVTTDSDTETKIVSQETPPSNTNQELPISPSSANNQRWYKDLRIIGFLVAATVLFVIVPMDKPSETMSSTPTRAPVFEEVEQEDIHMTETKQKNESPSKEAPPSSATIELAKDVMSALEERQQSVEQAAKEEATQDPVQGISIKNETIASKQAKYIDEIYEGTVVQENLPKTVQKPTRTMEPSTQQIFSTTTSADMSIIEEIEEEDLYVTDNDAPIPVEKEEKKGGTYLDLAQDDMQEMEDKEEQELYNRPEPETVQQSAVEDVSAQAPMVKAVLVESSTTKSAKNNETRGKADSTNLEKKSAERKNKESAGNPPSASENVSSGMPFGGSGVASLSSVLSNEQQNQAKQITNVEQAQQFCAQTNATACVDMLYIASKNLMSSTAISLLLLTNNYPSAQKEYLRRNFAVLSQLYSQIGNTQQAEVYSTKAQ